MSEDMHWTAACPCLTEVITVTLVQGLHVEPILTTAWPYDVDLDYTLLEEQAKRLKELNGIEALAVDCEVPQEADVGELEELDDYLAAISCDYSAYVKE